MSGESTGAIKPSGFFDIFLSCFLCRAAVFHASAWVSVQLSLSVCLSTGCGWLMVLVPVVCHTFRVQWLYVAFFGAVRGSSSVLLLCSRIFMRWDVVPPPGFCAAGCLPLCRYPRGRQAGVWREQNVSITPSARKPSHQQLLLPFSGDRFLMSHFFTLSIPTCRPVWRASSENLCGSDATYFDFRVAR